MIFKDADDTDCADLHRFFYWILVDDAIRAANPAA